MIRIGARGSKLALWQANWVAGELQRNGFETDLKIISTHGDRVTDRPLNQLGVQGVFTKEIEEALLSDQIDLAVHSFKDVASEQPDGLEIIAVTEREDASDMLIIHPVFFDASQSIPVAIGSVVGTSAVRRISQLKALRSDLVFQDLRGNVPTRLDKLANGDYGCIFLAQAGINRLEIDLSSFKVHVFAPTTFIPSPGQGALAIEIRSDFSEKERIKTILNHDETALATQVERHLLAKFGGGCSLPLGAYAYQTEGTWDMFAFWSDEKVGAVWEKVSGANPEALSDEIYKKIAIG